MVTLFGERRHIMSSYFGLGTSGVNTLFSGFSSKTNSTSFSTNMLSNYYSIQNGSYRKLLSAYYDKFGTEDSKEDTSSSSSISSSLSSVNTSASISTDDSKTLVAAKENATDLYDSIQPLVTRTSSSVFEKEKIKNADGTETEDYNRTKITDALQKYVDDYNTVIESADNINSSSLLGSISGMTTTTAANEKLLSKIGITINEDNTLSLNKETAKTANVEAMKSVFQGAGSYAYQISAKASQLKINAGLEANRANTYTNYGTYASNYASGNIYNNWF